MVDPSLRNELMRFRMKHLQQAAEHHRTRRRGDSPRRPDREHPER